MPKFYGIEARYIKDIRGERQHNLVALRPIRRKEKIAWICRCDCGSEVTVSRTMWRRQISCGCMKAARISATKTKHGRSNTPEYVIWTGMLRRCRRSKDKSYKNYGGRGIKVCDRWNDFACFLADMGQRPAPHLMLERVDNNGDYEPGNCQWADRKTQNSNRRSVYWIEYQGVRKTAKDWARTLGLDGDTIRNRLQDGASPEQALSKSRFCRSGSGVRRQW